MPFQSSIAFNDAIKPAAFRRGHLSITLGTWVSGLNAKWI